MVCSLAVRLNKVNRNVHICGGDFWRGHAGTTCVVLTGTLSSTRQVVIDAQLGLRFQSSLFQVEISCTSLLAIMNESGSSKMSPNEGIEEYSGMGEVLVSTRLIRQINQQVGLCSSMQSLITVWRGTTVALQWRMQLMLHNIFANFLNFAKKPDRQI